MSHFEAALANGTAGRSNSAVSSPIVLMPLHAHLGVSYSTIIGMVGKDLHVRFHANRDSDQKKKADQPTVC